MTDLAPEAAQRRLIIRLAVATIAPIGMMLVALAMKPMWRDEFWSLYFSDPSIPLADLFAGRLRVEHHPPLYYVILHFWRQLFDSDLWVRALAIPFLAIGVFGAMLFGRGRRELVLFLLLCAGSYWVIYFTTEVRPYTLLFVLCAWSVLILARALEARARVLPWAAAWALVGALVGVTHYFGALWIACAGLATGIAFLMRGRFADFLIWGVASVLALGPMAYWLTLTLPEISGHGLGRPGPHEPGIFATQFFRGLLVKLFGSNLAVTAAAFAGFAALMRRRERLDVVLLGAALLLVLVSLAVDLAVSPIVKERSFCAIMPALLFVMTRAVLDVNRWKKWGRRFLTAIPIMAAISPFLFIPEYFKDRERLGEARQVLREEVGDCSGSPVVAYLRVSEDGDAFQRELALRQIRAAAPAGAPPPVLVSATEVDVPPAVRPGCRLHAVAFILPPGEREHHADARAALRAAGVPLDRLAERRFGKGRNLLFVEPAPESAR